MNRLTTRKAKKQPNAIWSKSIDASHDHANSFYDYYDDKNPFNTVQTKFESNQSDFADTKEVSFSQTKTNPQNKVPNVLQTKMEHMLNADFSNVKVHTNSTKAKQLRALAYTQGNNIYFAPGQFNPGSTKGQKLIAHELTHVKQQREGRTQTTLLAKGMAVNSDPGLEREADEVAEKVTNYSMPLQSQKSSFFHYNSNSSHANFKNIIIPKTIIQKYDDEATHDEMWGDLIESARNLQINMNSRYRLLSSYINIANHATSTLSLKLNTLSDIYEKAYTQYKNVILKAKEHAAAEEFWTELIIGVLIGMAVATASAAILPTAAASATSALSISLRGALETAASAAAQGATGTFFSYQAATHLVKRPATNINPTGIKPELMKMNIWKNVAILYKRALSYNKITQNLHEYTVYAGDLIADILRHQSGNIDEDTIPLDDIFDDILNLTQIDEKLISPANIGKKIMAISNFQDKVNNIKTSRLLEYSMEQDIWILWISSLKDPSVIDADIIENHLLKINVIGSNSRLNVDFGNWTTEDDEKEAWQTAKNNASKINEKYKKLMNSEVEI